MSREPDATIGREPDRPPAIPGRAAGPAADETATAGGPAAPGSRADSDDPAARPGAREVSPTGAWSTPRDAIAAPGAAGVQSETEPLSRRDGDDQSAGPPGGSDETDDVSPPVLEPGRVVLGRYRLEEKLGEGGMGEVWKVRNLELDRTGALKLIKPEIARNDKGWARFRREARLMARIDHPGVVAVYDFRRDHSVGYIEMEYVRGRSLDRVLREAPGQALPLDRVASILEQLCSVLEAVHGHRDAETGRPMPIIHRDLKPSNLMLDDRGGPVLKVLDFGIAKMIEDDAGAEVTATGDIVGTPAYMSPEQIRGDLGDEGGPAAVDARSDLYSAGVLLFYLLTGVLPFRGTRMTLLASHLVGQPMGIREANPAVAIPPAVERVIRRCLEKDPARRPQSARALAEDFRRAVAAPDDDRAGAPVPGPTRPRAASRSRLAAVVVALLAAGLIPLAWRPRGPDPATTGSPPIARAGAPEAVPPRAKAARVEAATAAGAVPVETPPRAGAGWMPAGFAAHRPGALGPSGLPTWIRRTDGALFVHRGDGKYLPFGYRQEDPGKTIGGWPSAIVRESDGVRFVRIDGGVYLRGDPIPRLPPVSDGRGYPITRHFVRVEGFYIQDREVTNGEVLHYWEEHPDEHELLADWRPGYDHFRASLGIDEGKFGRLPAVSMSYRAARRYAASVGGLLPTEAQWEYVAKSRKDARLFAWGDDWPAAGERPANLDNPEFAPAEAGSYARDTTEQGVRDMAGNVRELCADAYRPYEEIAMGGLANHDRDRPIVDRREAATPDKVVVRGGSFLDKPQKALTFMRDSIGADGTNSYVGFRVVIECPSRPEVPASDPR